MQSWYTTNIKKIVIWKKNDAPTWVQMLANVYDDVDYFVLVPWGLQNESRDVVEALTICDASWAQTDFGWIVACTHA